MTTKVNLKDIASNLNLSVGTVSRVLNGKAKEYRIKEETVKRVLAYADKVGYSPNLLAKGLRNSKTYTIGLMIPDIANPFFSMMAKHIQRAASDANYTILLVDAEEDIEKEEAQVRNLLNRQVDAIIAAPVGTSFKHFTSIQKQNIPFIFVDRYSKEDSIPFITSDNYQGGLDATNHLLSNGHRAIALVRGLEDIEPVIERRRGYEDALSQAGVQIRQDLMVGNDFTEKNGYESTKTLLELSNPPSAIFAMSNLIGLGVLKAVKEKGLRIPEDISVIVFDDQPYVAYLNPPITTVKQNSEQIGILAIDLILKKIEQKNLSVKSQMIPVKLINRSSVRDISGG